MLSNNDLLIGQYSLSKTKWEAQSSYNMTKSKLEDSYQSIYKYSVNMSCSPRNVKPQIFKMLFVEGFKNDYLVNDIECLQ